MTADKRVAGNPLHQVGCVHNNQQDQSKPTDHVKFEELLISCPGTISSNICSKKSNEKNIRAKRKQAAEPMDSKKSARARKGQAVSKYQNHYEPSVPMTKEEEAKWRIEARKKRNRDSAAASRRKVHSKITELENEVKEWKSKYNSLYQKLNEMEKILKGSTSTEPQASEQENCTNEFIPLSLGKNESSFTPISPNDSPILQPNNEIHVIPDTFTLGSISPTRSFTFHQGSNVVNNQHINEFVSRQA